VWLGGGELCTAFYKSFLKTYKNCLISFTSKIYIKYIKICKEKLEKQLKRKA